MASEQQRLSLIFSLVIDTKKNDWKALSENETEAGFSVREFENSTTHEKVTVTQMDDDGLYNVKWANSEANLRFPANW